MAYPTVSAPYGLKPVNRLDGMPYAGATRQVAIASAYGSNIFNGDLVQIDTNGQCVVSVVSNETNVYVVGVFLGCSYTNPTTKQKLFSQYWPTGTVASDAVAYVVDDPSAVFKIAVVSGTTVVSTVARAAIGANMFVVQNSGLTSTGNSRVAGNATVATSAYALRIIDVVPETATGADAFSEVIVKINQHQYNNTTGV